MKKIKALLQYSITQDGDAWDATSHPWCFIYCDEDKSYTLFKEGVEEVWSNPFDRDTLLHNDDGAFNRFYMEIEYA